MPKVKESLSVVFFEGTAYDTTIERRDNDNANIEENVIDSEENFTKSLPGAPENWYPPCPPEGWTHVPDTAREEPAIASVNNPGGWSPYTFRAKFSARGSTGRCLHHEMLTGAQVVPKNTVGVREVNGWTFQYGG